MSMLVNSFEVLNNTSGVTSVYIASAGQTVVIPGAFTLPGSTLAGDAVFLLCDETGGSGTFPTITGGSGSWSVVDLGVATGGSSTHLFLLYKIVSAGDITASAGGTLTYNSSAAIVVDIGLWTYRGGNQFSSKSFAKNHNNSGPTTTIAAGFTMTSINGIIVSFTICEIGSGGPPTITQPSGFTTRSGYAPNETLIAAEKITGYLGGTISWTNNNGGGFTGVTVQNMELY